MRVHIGTYPAYNKKKRIQPARKIRIKVDRWDSWSAYETIALIAVPVLKQLKKTKHGAPFTEDKDVPRALRSRITAAAKKQGKLDKNHFKRWDWILREIIWGFEQLTKDFERQYHRGKIDLKFVEQPDGGSIMEKGPKDTHRFDRAGYDAHCKRIEGALTLFAKYAMALWD